MDTVEAQLRDWARRQAAANPAAMAEWAPSVTSLRDETVGAVRQPILVTLGGVGVLLLVACCNVAAILLAQGRARQRTFALCVALGSGRARLLRQLLVEGAVLAAAGSALAVLFAAMAQRSIVALSMDQIPRVDLLQVDGRVLTVALAIGALTTVVFALGPALAVSRVDASTLMGRSARTVAGVRGRLLPWLAAVEFALAVVLVASAGLLANSYRQLQRVDLGFEPERAAVARVTFPLGSPWNNVEVRRRFYDDWLSRLRVTGAILDAGVTAKVPLEVVRGSVDVNAVGDAPDRAVQSVLQESSEGYFSAAGARIVAGRDFSVEDRADRPSVAVINDVLARHLFPAGEAVGRDVTFNFMRGPVRATVVGVIAPIRYEGLTGDFKPEVYLTFRQGLVLPLSLVYRVAGDPAAVIPAIRAALREADPAGAVTLDGVASFDTRLSQQLARPRFFLVLVGSFAGIGFLLAALGIYGTLSFWIAQHRREFGVRLALGATRSQVSGLVVRRGMAFAGVGVAVGLGITVTIGHLLESLLFGVAPTDVATLVAAGAILLAVAAAVCAVPARRAARVDPIETLRAE
jgi:predicted permease